LRGKVETGGVERERERDRGERREKVEEEGKQEEGERREEEG